MRQMEGQIFVDGVQEGEGRNTGEVEDYSEVIGGQYFAFLHLIAELSHFDRRTMSQHE